MLQRVFNVSQKVVLLGGASALGALSTAVLAGQLYTQKDVKQCTVPKRSLLHELGPASTVDVLKFATMGPKDCFQITVPMQQVGRQPAYEILSQTARAFFSSPTMRFETWLFKALEEAPELTTQQIAAKSLSPGEQLSAWRVVAREYGDEQDNLIMETASGVFTWMQVEADSDSELYYFRFGSSIHSNKFTWPYKVLMYPHTVYSKVLLKSTVQGLGLTPAACQQMTSA